MPSRTLAAPRPRATTFTVRHRNRDAVEQFLNAPVIETREQVTSRMLAEAFGDLWVNAHTEFCGCDQRDLGGCQFPPPRVLRDWWEGQR